MISNRDATHRAALPLAIIGWLSDGAGGTIQRVTHDGGLRQIALRA